jgi:hypothetical protein
MITMAIQGAQSLRDVSAELKKASRGDLKKAMVRRIRKAGAPALLDVRNAVLNLPAAPPHADLRKQIAKATRLRVLTSRNAAIRIEVNSARLPADKRAMPRVTDSRGWRHPVHGTDRWVFQPSQPWFFVTALRHAPRFRSEVEAAMDDVRRQIEEAA